MRSWVSCWPGENTGGCGDSWGRVIRGSLGILRMMWACCGMVVATGLTWLVTFLYVRTYCTGSNSNAWHSWYFASELIVRDNVRCWTTADAKKKESCPLWKKGHCNMEMTCHSDWSSGIRHNISMHPGFDAINIYLWLLGEDWGPWRWVWGDSSHRTVCHAFVPSSMVGPDTDGICRLNCQWTLTSGHILDTNHTSISITKPS